MISCNMYKSHVLFMHLSVDVQIVSTFWVLLFTFMCIFVRISVLTLSMYLGMEMLCHMVILCNIHELLLNFSSAVPFYIPSNNAFLHMLTNMQVLFLKILILYPSGYFIVALIWTF